MSDDAIDPAVFRELQSTAGAEFVAELVDTFLEEAPRMLDELHAALGAQDTERFRRAAHSLKSNCQTFGASGLGNMARGLELAAQAAVHAADARPLDALAVEYARAAAALRDLRNA